MFLYLENSMPTIVAEQAEVRANIRRYQSEIAAQPELQRRMGRVHAWYALFEGGKWLFGPSKFVGYRDNRVECYLKTYRDEADGGTSERALDRLFGSAVDPDSRLGHELSDALAAFLRQWGKTPRKGARITVVSETPAGEDSRRETGAALSRVVSNPKVCGGRPCIRGTRIRVSDILDMLAAGASAKEILDDYPDLANDDIRAALAYAARIADHRIIRAA